MESFERRGGTSNMAGELFEVKILALLFLRGLNRTQDFRLATNMEHCGDFDDVIFQYKSLDDGENWKTCFMQLKHRMNKKTLAFQAFYTQGSDFDLLKYFKSYSQIAKMMTNDSNNPIFSCSAVNNCNFVLFTNSKFLSKSIPERASNHILNTGNPGGLFSFLNTSQSDRIIFKMFDDLKICDNALSSVYQRSLRSGFLRDLDIEEIKELIQWIKDKDLNKAFTSFIKQPTVERLRDLNEKFKCLYDVSKNETFVSNLQVFHGQSRSDELDDVIMKEIHCMLRTGVEETNRICEDLKKEVKAWWEGFTDIGFLTKNTNFWTRILSDRKLRVDRLSETKLGYLNKLGLSFCESEIDKLRDILEREQVLNVVSHECSTLITCLKIQQALKMMGANNYIIIDLSSLQFQLNDVISLWPSQWCDILVLDCGENECNFEFPPQGKLVIVSSSNLYGGWDHRDEFELHMLNKESKNKIMEKKVNFQGYIVSLGQLVANNYDLESSITAEFVMQLLCEISPPEIGRELEKVDEYYVAREIERKVPLSYDVIRELDLSDALVISYMDSEDQELLGINKKNIYQLHNNPKYTNVVLCSEDEYNFENISEILNKGYNVHCLQWQSKVDDLLLKEYEFNKYRYYKGEHGIGDLKWRESYGDTKNISKFIVRTDTYVDSLILDTISKHKTAVIEPNMYTNTKEEIMLLTAEPGMGKSTLLTSLAREAKESNPASWVIRVNLNDHTSLLNTMSKSYCNLEECVDILWEAVGRRSNSKFEKALFRYAVMESENSVILFDGFDEISPTYDVNTIYLIKVLISGTKSNLWVTSRPTFREFLETELNTLSFTLKPMNLKEQIKFVYTFWKKEITNHRSDIGELCSENENSTKIDYSFLMGTIEEDNKLNDFIEESLATIAFSVYDSMFCTTPLHLKIIATVFLKYFFTFLQSNEISLPHIVNTVEMYERFVKVKLEMYYREMKVEDETKIAVQADREEIEKLFFQNHTTAALVTLLTKDLLDQLHDKEIETKCKEFLKRVKSGKVKYGIIVEVVSGKPQFVHRTFAEYFAAHWFYNNYRNNKRIVKTIYTTHRYKVISEMLDIMLCIDFPLHKAILDGKKSDVKNMITEVDVNSRDAGGRTPLHLASSLAEIRTSMSRSNAITNLFYLSIVKELLSNGASVNIPDDLLELTPVQYAERGHRWEVLGILLKGQVTCHHDFLELQKMCVSYDSFLNPMTSAAMFGHLELLKLSIELGGDYNRMMNSKYLIHVAAEYGKIDVLRFLLSLCSDVDRKDAKGYTPFLTACDKRELKVIRLLVEEYNADISAQTLDGRSAKDLIEHYPEISEYLSLIN